MPHSNDIQMMINHVNNNDHDKYSHISSTSQSQSHQSHPQEQEHEHVAKFPATSTSSSLSYDSLCLLLLHRDAREMRHLRQLLRQHLTWREHLMEWSKFLLNIIVAIIAVIVGIQTLQSRVSSVQTAVDALTGSVNQVSGNVATLSTSIKQSQQDVVLLQNNAAGLNNTMIGMNEQLYDIQELSNQLAYNITKLNVSQAMQQVSILDTQINLLTNQSIIWNDELIHARIQLQQQNISTYTQLDQLATTSQQHMTSLITYGQTNLSHYIQMAPTIVTTLLQPIQQNLTLISADISRRVRSVGFCNYSTRTSGAAGGYAGVRSLCRTACSSMTARECSSSDIFQQYYTTGFVLPWSQQYTIVWVSSPTTSYYTSLGANKEYLISDCNYWSSAGDIYGNSMNVGASYPITTITKCNAQLSFACCDYIG